jgi:hypothetical protein
MRRMPAPCRAGTELHACASWVPRKHQTLAYLFQADWAGVQSCLAVKRRATVVRGYSPRMKNIVKPVRRQPARTSGHQRRASLISAATSLFVRTVFEGPRQSKSRGQQMSAKHRWSSTSLPSEHCIRPFYLNNSIVPGYRKRLKKPQ